MEVQQETHIAATKNSYQDNNIEYRGDGIEVDKSFESTLSHKFSLFKSMITKALYEENPAIQLRQ